MMCNQYTGIRDVPVVPLLEKNSGTRKYKPSLPNTVLVTGMHY